MIKDYDTTLYFSCYHFYGNCKEAIIKSGLYYVDSYVKWSKEKVESKIKKIISLQKPLNPSFIKNNHPKLYVSSIYYFGSWKNALGNFGVCYEEVFKSLKNYWTREKIIQELKYLSQNETVLEAGFIKIKYGKLFSASVKEFGSWREALNSVGVDYSKILLNSLNSSKCGLEFEYLLGQMLIDLDIDFTKKKYGTLIPDFTLSDGTIIDAKLSEWTINNCNTIDNYEPLCDNLVIIFMRGNKNKDSYISKKTRLVSVHRLIKKLPKVKQRYYESEFIKLENMLNDLENTMKNSDDIANQNKNGKKVVRLSIYNEYIDEFDNLKQAKKILNIDDSHISKVCRGVCKTAGGYKWVYKEDYNNFKSNANFRTKWNGKKVLKLDSQNHILTEFPSVSEAVRQTNISSISAVCLGKRKTAGGFKWVYKENYDNFIKEQINK